MSLTSQIAGPSNQRGCFRACIGRTITGYFDAQGDIYLVLDDGCALVIHHETGAYWVAVPSDVDRALRPVKQRLEADVAALQDVLTVAGKQRAVKAQAKP